MAVRTDFVNSFIGENSYFEGKFLVNGVLHINGKFEGNVLKVDQVFIGQTGRVKADLIASSIVIEGIVIGNIKASTRVMLMPTARVLGDIHTPELIIQNGVILEGRCHISNNMTHSAKDIILKQYNG
ncbi:MAG: polymer-forming cytoskeletal protein [Brevinematales bacterium]|nr:polymer-forming cytoskeletal protein [Brevinematales bacterium]